MEGRSELTELEAVDKDVIPFKRQIPEGANEASGGDEPSPLATPQWRSQMGEGEVS